MREKAKIKRQSGILNLILKKDSKSLSKIANNSTEIIELSNSSLIGQIIA